MTFYDASKLSFGDVPCTMCGRDSRECREPFSYVGHNSRIICICSPKCMEAFLRDPDRYAENERARLLPTNGADRDSAKQTHAAFAT